VVIHYQRVSGAKLEISNDPSGIPPNGANGDRFLTTPAPAPPPFLAQCPIAPAPVGNGQSPSTGSVARHCPVCDGDQTQPVSVIYSALTRQTLSRKSLGQLSPDGNILWGRVSGGGGASTLSTQQSQLAKRLAPPVIDSARLVEAGRSRVAAAGGGAIVAFLVVMIPLIVLGNQPPAMPAGPDVQQPDASHPARALMALAVIALFGLPILVFAKVSARFDAEIARLRQEEWQAFDRKKQDWKNSLFCFHCGKIFSPATRPEE